MIGSGDNDNLNKALSILQQGGIILAPTDTVWGLMCDYKNAEAVASIFRIKKSRYKPMAILCDSLESVDKLEVEMPVDVRRIAERFWPGPLTLILKSRVPGIEYIAGKGNSIGVRVPDLEELRGLIKKFGRPLAATSANISGQGQALALDDVPDEITLNADYICRFAADPSGQASTVVDCSSEKLKLIRVGVISLEILEKAMN